VQEQQQFTFEATPTAALHAAKEARERKQRLAEEQRKRTSQLLPPPPRVRV
jgi:hypothetical protein